MKFLQKNYQRLEDALRAAYLQQEATEVELDHRWQTDVMRDIRRLGPLNASREVFQMVNRVVWRFATVACVIALLLAGYAGVNGWNPVEEVSALFLNDPVEFTV
ncbi:hypothetical protein GF348_01630, partial [candidate division KSB3 bacterium]|nr:hypothetical protein [candidate division KSB3 bacterium]